MTYVFGKTPSGNPKTELSYSGWSLWLKNKELYRQKYYENVEPPSNPEMLFGKKIAERLESNDPKLAHVPRYSHPEHEIRVRIGGVPVVGYLDSFDPDGFRFLEYKTSHGQDTWNPVTVAKHSQLDFYSLLIHEKYGKVDRHCSLVWLQTQYRDKMQMFHGQTFGLNIPELELTGKIKIFPRIIFRYDRERIKKSIISVAEEITNDWKKIQQNNSY